MCAEQFMTRLSQANVQLFLVEPETFGNTVRKGVRRHWAYSIYVKKKKPSKGYKHTQQAI